MNRHLRNDLLLIGGILLTALILFVGIRLFSSRGVWAVVERDGHELTRLPLNSEAEYTVSDEYGTNVIRTGNGRVWMEEADCPDRLCVRQGPVSSSAGRIVCLPHRIVIRIIGTDEAPDAILE